jgi:allantoin racemase
MRIDVIVLISGLSKKTLKRRQEYLQSYTSAGTKINLVFTRNAPPSVDSLPEMELAATGILERAILSEKEGADAIVIWGGHDPSVMAVRSLVNIPVIGPGMASMHLANMLAEKFSLIVQLPHVVNLSKRQVRELGLEEKCIGVFPVNLPVLELGKKKSFNKILETVIESIKEGAEAICFGCMAMNDHAEEIADELSKSHPGILVIHPGKSVIKIAELLIELNISHSKQSYPDPPKKIKFI